MENKIEIRHLSLTVSSNFESFTKAVESLLGRFDYDVYKELEDDPRLIEEHLKEMAGEEDLMLFNIQDHGKLLRIRKITKKGKQYILGNPLIAIQMTQHDIRAGLYAPLRIFVYESDDNSTRIEYDLPSSLFGQFQNAEVTEIAKSLDRKLEKLIAKADGLSG